MGHSPELLVLGHVTRDILADGGSRLGGTALYAAITAARLGFRAAIYTTAGPDLDRALLEQSTAGIELLCLPAPTSTVFCNQYEAGRRRQFLLSRAPDLLPDGLPDGWAAAPLVLLGPVAQEVSPGWVDSFPRAWIGACLQGWLRAWNRDGRVHFAAWTEAARWLPRFSAAFFSREDIRCRPGLSQEYAASCPLLVCTEGAAGAVLYQHGRPERIQPFLASEVDPTGAGDIFATAMLLRLAEGASPAEAARFAAAAGALSVEGKGIEGIPRREEVERLLGGKAAER